MLLHNSLTRKLDHFTPQTPGEVSLYTCGPTVYDYPHIGNLATYARWDLLVRVLRESGYLVGWVMNITDVGHLTSDADEGEDKLEKGARREGKTAWQIADFYTKNFVECLDKLNIQHPTHMPKATEHIPEQIEIIKKLEEKGYTYATDDGVYFDTSKFKDYGKLAQLDVAALKAGARVEANPQKRNSSDFALWKFSPKDQKRDMEWDSPWGKGFPGWHLECSAMSMKYLGNTLDIHAGGIDHLPVHHVNEIAQSEAATGKLFSRFWLHANHILIDGARIAKSEGNGIILEDLLKKGFSPMDVRLLFLQSHYRTSANFSLSALEAARQRRLALQAFADLRFQTVDGGELDTPAFVQTKAAILQELQNDLHTPEAFAALSDIVGAAESSLVSKEARPEFENFIAFLDRVLGLKLNSTKDISDEQKKLIAEREKSRSKKDFEAADNIRNQLAEQNIELRDTPLSTIWSRTA